MNTQESPFFLMFRRDPILPLINLIKPEIRYLGNDENILSLEALKNIYEIAATYLKHARERYGSKTPLEKHIKDGDLVLIKNNVRKPFEPRYTCWELQSFVHQRTTSRNETSNRRKVTLGTYLPCKI